MNFTNGWLQFALYVGALLLVTKPLGLYLVRVLDARGRPRSTAFSSRSSGDLPAFGRKPRAGAGLGRLHGLDAPFSLVGMLFTYLVLRFQDSPLGRSTPRNSRA